MQQPVPDDGIIRKLWINETDAYRDHLLRLDRVSRNRRFSGAVSDELIARHGSVTIGNRCSPSFLSSANVTGRMVLRIITRRFSQVWSGQSSS